MNDLTKKKRLEALFSVYFVAALDNFGLGLVFILFAPLVLKPEFGLISANVSIANRNLLLGLLFAAFPLMQLFGAPIFGNFADNYGRKKAFYYTIGGITIGYALSGVAILFKSYLFLLVSRFLSGFFAGNLSVCLASIADLSPNEKMRARYFGYITVLWGVTWPSAMFIGGYLSDPKISIYFSPSLPFWICVVASILNFIAIAFFFPETHVKQAPAHFHLAKGIHNIITAIKSQETRLLFIVLLFWTVGTGLAVQWYSVVALEKYKISEQTISLGLAAQGLFWLFSGSLINPLMIKYFKTKTIALIGFVFATFFIGICSLFDNFYVFSALYWTASLGTAIAASNTMSLISFSSREATQGRTMGLSQSMTAFAWFLIPLVGAILGKTNTHLFYPTAALFVLVALTTLSFYTKKHA